MGGNIFEFPQFGWKAKLDYVFPEKRGQNMIPKIKQIFPMIPLLLRYLLYSIIQWSKGLRPVMDFIFPVQSKQNSGVPLGGIGGGSMGRGFRGEFYNFQMIPGMYELNTVAADQFILTVQNEKCITVYQSVLSVQSKPKRGLSSWNWEFPGVDAEYTGLYPRAWTVFNIPEQNIKVICRQVSPVIPHNYKDSCIPSSAFEWTLINNNNEKRYMSITFTMKNGTGGKHDKSDAVRSSSFERSKGSSCISGVLINQKINNIPYSYAVSALKVEGVSVTKCTYFDPNGDGSMLWKILQKSGELEINNPGCVSRQGELACAVCAKTEVSSCSLTSVSFSLVWDMPKIKFTYREKEYLRYYTKYFGSDGNAAPAISLYTLTNYKKWESAIYDWQQPILDDMTLPDWYKSALFNEVYYVANGGTVWLLTDESEELQQDDPRLEYGRFAYLEGQEYRMYNTYDVHFYASFALALLWPKLQASVQYDFRDSIDIEDKTSVCYLYNGQRGYRKTKFTVPHDLGDPGGEPFILINAYPIHDVAEWRDLNLKFVLQVFRDYSLENDLKLVNDMFPQLVSVMNHAQSWDKDGDGMIENSGTPDQTYDAWTMTGTSAYCGSLWVAALFAMVEMSEKIGKTELADKYADLLSRAKSAFEIKLWNGKYYNFDCSNGAHSQSIMSDQLCGLWYLRSSKVENEIFPTENVCSALNTVYEYNVKKYYNGKQGSVNGMMPDGNIDTFAIQSEEVWTGVTYALASLMIYEGMLEKGFATAKGIYETVYERAGLGFATPEALHGNKSYRSVGYMRPLSIWSIQLALENKK